MIEKIKETGRKSVRFILKIIAVLFIYCFGAITGPNGWDLREFIDKIANDPKWTTPIISLITVVVLFLVVLFVVKIFFKKE